MRTLKNSGYINAVLTGMVLLFCAGCSTAGLGKATSFYVIPSIAPALAFEDCVRKKGISDDELAKQGVESSFISVVNWQEEVPRISSVDINVKDPDKKHQKIYERCKIESRGQAEKIIAGRPKESGLPNYLKGKAKNGIVRMDGTLFPVKAVQVSNGTGSDQPLNLSYEEKLTNEAARSN